MVHNKQVQRKCQSKCILMCLYNKLQEKINAVLKVKTELLVLISSVLFVVYQQLCLSHSLCLQ